MSTAEIIMLVVKASIMLSVFAIGLKADFAEASYLFRRPLEFARVLLSMNVVMPAIAIALSLIFDLHPAVKIALGALSVSPIPPILPNKALKAGGEREYVIGLLVGTGVTSVIVIPIAMKIFERVFGASLAMSPGAIATLVLTTILIPLIAGILVRSFLTSIADRVAKPISVISTILLVLGVLPILASALKPMRSLFGDGTIIALTIFAVAGCLVGHLLGGPQAENRGSLALATASRHPAIALAIAQTNFPEEKLTAPAILLYVVLSAVVSSVYFAWMKKRGTQ